MPTKSQLFIMISPFMFHSCVILPLFFSVQAQAVTLTVAQAFKVALDLWEIAQEGELTEQRESFKERWFSWTI